MKTQPNRSDATVIPVVLDEWRAWDKLRQAIERRLDNPTEENEQAVRAASRAFVEVCGERTL